MHNVGFIHIYECYKWLCLLIREGEEQLLMASQHLLNLDLSSSHRPCYLFMICLCATSGIPSSAAESCVKGLLRLD